MYVHSQLLKNTTEDKTSPFVAKYTILVLPFVDQYIKTLSTEISWFRVTSFWPSTIYNVLTIDSSITRSIRKVVQHVFDMKDFFSLTLCKQLNIAGVPCSILDDLRQGKCVTPSEEWSVAKDKPPIHNHTFKHSVSDSKLGQIHFIQMRNESIPFPYAFLQNTFDPISKAGKYFKHLNSNK